MSYRLMWSPEDKASILEEIEGLRAEGNDEEVSRVLAYMSSIADEGTHARAANIHTYVGERALHSVCPFGSVGVFYAYASPPNRHIYILAFCPDVYRAFPEAAERMTHVP